MLSEASAAWESQTALDSILQYTHARAVGKGAHMLVELSQLTCDLSLLPQLGFPQIQGVSEMPPDLYPQAIARASGFLDLVSNFISCVAWDYTWWSELWPQRFAKLLGPDALGELEQLREEWRKIQRLEKMLFKQAPSDSKRCESLLREAAQQHPEMAKHYLFLDGVTAQLSRELIFLLEPSGWACVSPEARELLLDSFAVPCSTKSYTEDVFRDMRAAVEGTPVSKVTPWVRQKAAVDSFAARDKERILPVQGSLQQSSVLLPTAAGPRRQRSKVVFSTSDSHTRAFAP